MSDAFFAQNGFSVLSASNSAIFVFVVYIALVLLLAFASNRLRRSKSFLTEYFLGSRSLGVWAFALTFAATSASGGSFVGFPSLAYTHGWIVALWIGSYMIVPLVSMGFLAKRLNHVARKSNAITIPDVLRDRFNSPLFGLLSTMMIIFFLSFNLIAQFKSGSVILQTLLADVPLFQSTSNWVAGTLGQVAVLRSAVNDPGYVVCLLVFALVVIVYTTYGGFRAVVWTDVLQGVVMVGGVMFMLPITLWAVGGLSQASREMAAMVPPRDVTLWVTADKSTAAKLPADDGSADEATADGIPAGPITIPKNSWLTKTNGEGSLRLFRLKSRAELPPHKDVPDGVAVDAIEVFDVDAIKRIRIADLPLTIGKVVEVKETESYGEGQQGVYLTGPGPSQSRTAGFLPISLAISFFFMWTFSGAGQPSNMVRLMAFRDSRTLRRAIFTVSIYYSLIYFPMVIIFCCARVLLPGWETEPDRIMPEMARLVSWSINQPWLAGILVAAPFAAVMSTMDSFLLMISSAIVRDIYQRWVNPDAKERTIKRMTYLSTCVIGTVAVFAALNPPQLLQDIIVFTGSGLSVTFLVPVALSIYWPRFNLKGAASSMLAGFTTHTSLYAVGFWRFHKMTAIEPLGFHPFIAGLLIALLVAVSVTLLTKRPPQHLVEKYFMAEAPQS